jgi:xylulokinase
VGGGTKNALWLQATSDIGGVVQHVCEKTIGASYGDAFLAALAIGAVRPGDIRAWNPDASTVTPEVVPAYGVQYPIWKRLYQHTRNLMAALR